MDEDVDDATTYGNHPCEYNKDGNMMIKRSIKGSLQATTTISASQVASLKLITTMQVCIWG
jgi:hypothetical protein